MHNLERIVIKNEKNKIIKKWEKELTPPNYSNFMEFDQYQKKNAKFKKCYISQQDSSIFFHCRECCKVINGLYCVHCFNKSDHTDHHISVMYLDDAFCDCGDPKFIKRDCWCSLHINSVENTIYPNAEYHKLLKNKINEIFEYAIKNTGKESFSDSATLPFKPPEQSAPDYQGILLNPSSHTMQKNFY